MEKPYILLTDLAKELTPPPAGILSRILFSRDRLKVVGFGFAEGEELTEYTASFPLSLHLFSGEATITLGSKSHELAAGNCMYMAPKLPYSVRAKTPMTILLMLLKH